MADDRRPRSPCRARSGTWLVDGVLREDELEELTGFRLPEGPYETLAGFLMAELGHIPVAGEAVTTDGWEFTVVEVERRRIEQVRVVDRRRSAVVSELAGHRRCCCSATRSSWAASSR